MFLVVWIIVGDHKGANMSVSSPDGHASHATGAQAPEADGRIPAEVHIRCQWVLDKFLSLHHGAILLGIWVILVGMRNAIMKCYQLVFLCYLPPGSVIAFLY